MVVWDAHALVGEAARRVIMLIHADGTGSAETTLGRGHLRAEQRVSKDAFARRGRCDRVELADGVSSEVELLGREQLVILQPNLTNFATPVFLVDDLQYPGGQVKHADASPTVVYDLHAANLVRLHVSR